MIKVVIIDDEPLARLIIKEYLESYKELSIVEECNNGFEGVKAIAQHNPELVFLDVQMPKINGFEMLELIDHPLSVIFTTAFDEYALKAFEAHAVDYLLKPFSRERFDKAIQKWMERHKAGAKQVATDLLNTVSQQPDQHQRIVVKTGSKIKIIPVQDIHYIEADDDYVKLYTHEGRFVKKKTMQFFEQILPSTEFVRVHRSYIVKVQQIVKIEPHEKDSHFAILQSGAKIALSKAGYVKLKSVLGL